MDPLVGIDDELVSARSVLSDETRLAIDGYKLYDSDTELTLGLSIRLMDGQRELGNWPNIFCVANDTAGVAAKQRARCLLQACMEYLNTGGDPEDLTDFGNDLGRVPQLNFDGFRLAGICEEVQREVYYISKHERLIRVIPGLMSERVMQEELNATDEEEDCQESSR